MNSPAPDSQGLRDSYKVPMNSTSMAPASGRPPMASMGANESIMRDSARPMVSGGDGVPPYNTRQVYPYEPTADSATTDVYTGVMDYGKLTKLRERAAYDLNTLSYAPLADTGTGVLFPDAVRAKVEVETALRVRPTTFRGPQQLDLADEDGEVHINRQVHPSGTNMSSQVWYKNKGDLPFVGYPNPDLFYANTEIIPTHNVQNLSHAQMADALRAMTGAYDHDAYLNRVGALLRSGALSGPAHTSIDHLVASDGGGVNADPRLLERMNEEYERDFQKSMRIRVADATNDPRYAETAPATQYIKENHDFLERREDWFSKVQQWTGVGTAYTEPEIFRVG